MAVANHVANPKNPPHHTTHPRGRCKLDCEEAVSVHGPRRPGVWCAPMFPRAKEATCSHRPIFALTSALALALAPHVPQHVPQLAQAHTHAAERATQRHTAHGRGAPVVRHTYVPSPRTVQHKSQHARRGHRSSASHVHMRIRFEHRDNTSAASALSSPCRFVRAEGALSGALLVSRTAGRSQAPLHLRRRSTGT